jgi:hypothetical protein
MKNYWIKTLRRLAAASVVAGATAFSSAMSYAATIAFDTATDAAYDNGWQAGDNGGFGFGGWDFSGTYNTPVGQTMDIFSHPNDLGRAWTLFNADAPGGPGAGTDIAQAGRSLGGAMVPGDTLHVVIDNPTERAFFRGYTVRFNTGGGNTVFAGTPQSRMSVGTFEYGTNGKWFSTDGSPTLFDTDTSHGMRIDFTLTGPDTFHLVMTPLNNPAIAYTDTGTLVTDSDGNPANGNDNLLAGAPINWVEFELYNTDSDYYPTHTITGGDTDFYISNMWLTKVIPEPSAAVLLVLGAGVMFGAGGARMREQG